MATVEESDVVEKSKIMLNNGIICYTCSYQIIEFSLGFLMVALSLVMH